MIVRLASEQDANGFTGLAGQAEHWFGPMVDDRGFRAVTDKHIRQATALVAAASGETVSPGAVCFSAQSPRPITCNGWSSPNAHAGRASAAPS